MTIERMEEWPEIYHGAEIARRAGDTDNMRPWLYFKRLAVNEFVWEGLPFPSVLLERILYDSKYAVVYDDPAAGLRACPGSVEQFSIYEQPQTVRIVDAQGKTRTLTNGEDCVAFQDTASGISRKSCLHGFGDLEDIQETIRVQVKNQKMPMLLVAGTPEERDKKLNLRSGIADNYSAIVVDTSKLADIEYPKPTSVFNIEQLYSRYLSLIGQNLEMLGIDTSDDTVKGKERLVVEEVKKNDIPTHLFLQDALYARVEGCKAVNAMYGTAWSVRPADVLDERQPPETPEPDDGVGRWR